MAASEHTEKLICKSIKIGKCLLTLLIKLFRSSYVKQKHSASNELNILAVQGKKTLI